MKRVLKNDNGYSLLLAIGVVIIFTVLGLSLLTLTSSGIAKNSTREDTIQAQDLSDKGIDYVVKDIQTYLEDEIIDNPMGKTAFNTFLTNTLGKSTLSCPIDTDSEAIKASKGIKIPGENSNATMVCIADVAEIKNTDGVVEEKDKYKRLVTFKSIGTVNGKEHVTTSKVIIGTDAVPDQLRYAVSTNDGGNLHLHGGVEIQGDIKTSGNLIITNHASWGTATGETNRWDASVYPRLIRDSKSINPKLIMSEEDSNVYIFKLREQNDSTDYYLDKLETGTDLSNTTNYTKYSPKTQITEIQNSFFNTSNLAVFTRTIGDDQVDIEKEFQSIPYTASIVDDLDNNSSILNNTNKDTIYHIKEITECIRYKNGQCKESRTSSGTIDIGGSNQGKRNIKLVGKYYVDGDVFIDYANLTSDAILYVKGDVRINQSTLKSVSDESTLFIFAEGDITFANMHDTGNTDNINEVKGFFYSKSNLMLLGVKSHMKFIGGISGDRVILTGVRGKGINGSFDSVTTQESKAARLQIIYDANLIAQYHSFKRDLEEEFITELNEPELIERTQ